MSRRCVAPIGAGDELCGRPATEERPIQLAGSETVIVALCEPHAVELDGEETTMAKYEIDSIDSAFTHEWALECAYSVNGRILSTRPGRVVLEVESDPAVTGYLESLLDQDEAVSRYREID